MEPLCHREPDVGHPTANCPPEGSPSLGRPAPGGPSPSALPVTQTQLPGDGGSGQSLAKVGGQGRGLYSLRSPRAPTRRHRGSGCGRARGSSCALPRPPAPRRPPPSAPGRPAAWALRRRQLRAPGTQHHPPSTVAQGAAPWGSPSPSAPTAQSSSGTCAKAGGSQHCHGWGMPAPTLALGNGSLCRRPRAVCGDKGSVGRGDRGRHGRARRGLTWHPLPLAQPLAAVRVGVCRDMELGAQRRLEAPEGHPALGRKTTTALR